MRPVVFVKAFDKGSTVPGAHRTGDVLAGRGIPSRMVEARELGGIRDSPLVFIKKGDSHQLVAARLRGNRTILDVQDTLALRPRLKDRRGFDGLIFRSQRPLDDHGRGRPWATKFYLQWNPRFRPDQLGSSRFALASLGDPRSFHLWGQLPGVPCLGEDRFFEAAAGDNCHISIRRRGREWLYKPTWRVSTAAACDANLITTRDEAPLAVLGPDYPDYTEPDLESVLHAIDHARETFGTGVWRRGLAKMREVKEAHRLERIVDRYEEYLSEIDR